MVRRRQLKQRQQLPALVSRQRGGPNCTFDHVGIQVDQHKVVGWQFHFLVSTFNTYDVRARGLEGLNQTSGKYRNEDTGPLDREQEIYQGLGRQIEH